MCLQRIKQVVHHATKLKEAISAARGAPPSIAQITSGGYYQGIWIEHHQNEVARSGPWRLLDRPWIPSGMLGFEWIIIFRLKPNSDRTTDLYITVLLVLMPCMHLHIPELLLILCFQDSFLCDLLIDRVFLRLNNHSLANYGIASLPGHGCIDASSDQSGDHDHRVALQSKRKELWVRLWRWLGWFVG